MRLSFRDRENLQNSVEKLIVKNPNSNKRFIVNYFMKQGYAERTIYNMLNRISDGKASNQSHVSNVSKIWTPKRNYQLKRLAKNKVGVSSSKLSRKFSVHRSTINRQLIKLGISYRKRVKTPLYNEVQAARANN